MTDSDRNLKRDVLPTRWRSN